MQKFSISLHMRYFLFGFKLKLKRALYIVMTLAWLSAFHKITITLVILEGKRVGNVSAERVIPVQILIKEKISIPVEKMSQVGQKNENRALNVKKTHN